MVSREVVADLLRLDDERFSRRVPEALPAHAYDTGRLDRLGDPARPPPDPPGGSGSLADHEGAFVRRIRVLDDAPLGITLTGPAYADNPVVYANRTFRELTGYELDDLRGDNLRLLQGTDTAPEPVADLREALSTWSRTTVELTNYRRDGTPFRNRVSIVPVTDPAGSVVNWIGLQRAVEE
ncbi:PAS domain-containing protein [Halobaculum lipolyticum]|uniref:PAS domain-containing protein n=1 Tax=Halobaculum lipolyticum TaxID=3032001 RepID=A0ABD5W5G8_9EURY|nr:PAS domain-containing protein [Halobaculum sp. DT31]